MKSQTLGTGTSSLKVTNISKHGFWILVDQEELFLSFEEPAGSSPPPYRRVLC